MSALTSTLTWDEVVWVVSKVMGRNEGVSQGKKLLGFPNLEFVVADENVLARAQKLVEKYKLSPRDSIHVASALQKRTRTVISDDARLRHSQRNQTNTLIVNDCLPVSAISNYSIGDRATSWRKAHSGSCNVVSGLGDLNPCQRGDITHRTTPFFYYQH